MVRIFNVTEILKGILSIKFATTSIHLCGKKVAYGK